LRRLCARWEGCQFCHQGRGDGCLGPKQYRPAARTGSPGKHARSPEQSGFSTRRTRLNAAQKADIDRLASLRTTANAAYAAGECVACAARVSALRLMDRKPDCAAAAVSRQQLAAFTAALKVRDCDAAASIAQALE